MAFSFKKSDNKATHNWRPDFRDLERLPDVKAIRTDFLLNSLSGLAAAALLFWLIWNSMMLSELTGQIAVLDAQIDANTAQHRTSVQLNTQYQANAKQVEQLVLFSKQPIQVVMLMEEMSRTRPEEIIYSGINFNPVITRIGRNDRIGYTLSLQGSVRDGAGKDASAIITEFRNSLNGLESIGAFVDNSQLSSFTRNVEQALFNFNIQVSLDPAKK